MGFTDVQGLDFTLPDGPPLVAPPLSLLSESRLLVDLEGVTARRQDLIEKLHSAQEQIDNDYGDMPGEADTDEDAAIAIKTQMAEWQAELDRLDSFVAEWVDPELADEQRWEHGFVFLPELGNAEALSVFVPDSGDSKPDSDFQSDTLWYDPFVAVGLDRRSSFVPVGPTTFEERVARATRALRMHEAWQVENEFWAGVAIPTNYHLSASPSTPVQGAHRRIDAFPNPESVPGATGLLDLLTLSDSLAALDQAIADSDGGTGMIHAAPYVVQKWAQVYPYLRNARGDILTVNNNLIVPGYGYPGTGPDQDDRTVTDGVTVNGSTTVTSATAAFTAFDLGREITADGIPTEDTNGNPVVILTITSATEVVISAPATADASGVTLVIPGTGGRATGCEHQWAYATDQCFRLRGDIQVRPAGERELSPALTVDNDIPVRAERSHAVITNQIARVAVLVDTTTP